MKERLILAWWLKETNHFPRHLRLTESFLTKKKEKDRKLSFGLYYSLILLPLCSGGGIDQERMV